MYLKWIGGIFVFSACGGFGFILASAHRKEERMLRQVIAILDFMECELQYRLTPLPELCRQAAMESGGALRTLFEELAGELEAQISPDVESCMRAALLKVRNFPKLSLIAMGELGKSLGRFDLNGQLKGLEAVRQSCRRKLNSLDLNREVRLRSYQTLGLCAGAALAILFL